MISKADAEKLIESIEAVKFTPRSYFIDVVNFEMTCNVINAMVEPGSPEMVTCPNPNCRNGVLHRKGFLRSVCPDCDGTGSVPKDSQ